jgi:catechol 2,3-dioxygenase-like lactoylglutathione lyase family enzyme
MHKLCFHHLSIAVEDLERARQFYSDVLEMQELDRPDAFGHPGIWYQIGDGQPQLHILVRSEATLRRDKWIDLADIHFGLRVQSYRDTVAWLGSKGFRGDLPDDELRKVQLRPNPQRVTLKSTSSTPTATSSNSTARNWIEDYRPQAQ